MTVKVLVSSVGVLAVVLAGCGGAPFVAAEGSDVVVLGVGDGGEVVVVPPADADGGPDAGVEPAEAGGSLDAAPGLASDGGDAGEAGEVDDAGAADAADAACTPLEHESGSTGYPSCDPLGTDSEADALLACDAYLSGLGYSAGGCNPFNITAVGFCPSLLPSSPPTLAVCTQVGLANESCWIYAGPDKGEVLPHPSCAFTGTWN